MRVAQYVRRRVAGGVLLLVGVSILSFLLSALVPGDFLDEMRLNPQISPEVLTQLRSQYGLDRPLAERYVHWLGSAAHGNFGFSFSYNMPVSSLIWNRCRNTLLLAGTATMIIWIIALPLGILTATRSVYVDRVLTAGCSLLLSLPELAIILALLAFAVRSGAVPVGGMTSVTGTLNGGSFSADVARHLVVPVLALVLVGLPVVLQHTRSAMKAALEAPFIKAARGHGVGSLRLVLRHAFPVAANPVISLFGLSVAGLVGSSLLAEVITGWPGLGPLFVQSIFARDFYVVIAVVMLSSGFLVIGNLVGDLLLCTVDPRIRTD